MKVGDIVQVTSLDRTNRPSWYGLDEGNHGCYYLYDFGIITKIETDSIIVDMSRHVKHVNRESWRIKINEVTVITEETL